MRARVASWVVGAFVAGCAPPPHEPPVPISAPPRASTSATAAPSSQTPAAVPSVTERLVLSWERVVLSSDDRLAWVPVDVAPAGDEALALAARDGAAWRLLETFKNDKARPHGGFASASIAFMTQAGRGTLVEPSTGRTLDVASDGPFAVSSDGGRLATIGPNAEVSVVDLAKMAVITRFAAQGAENGTDMIGWLPDGAHLAIAGSPTGGIYEIASGKRTVPGAIGLVVSPAGDRACAARPRTGTGGGWDVEVTDIATGRVLVRQSLRPTKPTGAPALAFADDGRLVAVAFRDGPSDDTTDVDLAVLDASKGASRLESWRVRQVWSEPRTLGVAPSGAVCLGVAYDMKAFDPGASVVYALGRGRVAQPVERCEWRTDSWPAPPRFEVVDPRRYAGPGRRVVPSARVFGMGLPLDNGSLDPTGRAFAFLESDPPGPGGDRFVGAAPRLVLADRTSGAHRWQVDLQPLPDGMPPSFVAQWSPDGRSLAVNWNEQGYIVDAGTGKVRFTIPSIASLDFSKAGRYVLRGGCATRVCLPVDAETGTPMELPWVIESDHGAQVP